MKNYTDYIVEQAEKLLSIDSPSGYTQNAAKWLMKTYKEMGYEPKLTTKGGVLVQISQGTCEYTQILQKDRFSLWLIPIRWCHGMRHHA